MKAVKIEVISLSESESEAEERYLKIYYPDSTNFIEVPLDDEDGKLLLIDVKVMEPNIFALNLTSEKRGKLYKPKNGCFKEPKEKWSNFKVVAVLQPPVDPNFSKSLISDTCSNISSCGINQFLPTNVISTENETLRKKKKVQHFIEDLPTPSIQSPIDSTLNSYENEIKKKKSENIIHFSPSPSAQSPIDFENINFVEAVPSCDNAEITDAEIFAAYNVSSLNKLKELLCVGNSLFHDMFDISFKLLRKTLIGHPKKDIVKVLYYARRSSALLKTINPNMPNVCKQCNKNFRLGHLLSLSHITKYQSIYNDDPPEISILFNPDNFVHFMPTSALQKINPQKELYDYFTNIWFDKNIFESFKEYIIQRATKAKLTLSLNDPFFIEKLIFLRDAHLQHPNLKDIFPMKSFCISCNKSFNSYIDFFNHILSKKHMLSSLTQEELDKLVYAATFINYSRVDGFYYVSSSNSKKNRKRNFTEDEKSETISKRHRKF